MATRNRKPRADEAQSPDAPLPQQLDGGAVRALAEELTDASQAIYVLVDADHVDIHAQLAGIKSVSRQLDSLCVDLVRLSRGQS